jgi:16S rRNA processing protein RimM
MTAPLPADRVVLGLVVGAHGVRGHVRVRYFGDGPDTLLHADQIWLAESDDDARGRHFEVTGGGTARGGEARLMLTGVASRDAAMALRGALVVGEAALLEELPEGEFYWHQLVGCRVEDRDGRAIGTVVEIWETGAHDVLVVESEGGRRQLFSTARELMPEIDLEQRRIVVESLPGLYEPV